MLITSIKPIDEAFKQSVIDMATEHVQKGMDEYRRDRFHGDQRIKCAEYLAPVFAKLGNMIEASCFDYPHYFPADFKLTFRLEERSASGTNGWVYSANTEVTITRDEAQPRRKPLMVTTVQHTHMEQHCIDDHIAYTVRLDP